MNEKNASIKPGADVEVVFVPGGTTPPSELIQLFHSGRVIHAEPKDVEMFEAMGFSQRSDLMDTCPGCDKVIGRADHSDGPGDRWGCAACGETFCNDCHRPDGHVCNPKPIDAARFTDD